MTTYSDGKITPTKLACGVHGDGLLVTFESIPGFDGVGVKVTVGDSIGLISRKELEAVASLFGERRRSLDTRP